MSAGTGYSSLLAEVRHKEHQRQGAIYAIKLGVSSHGLNLKEVRALRSAARKAAVRAP